MKKLKCNECGKEYIISCFHHHVKQYHNNMNELDILLLSAKNNPRMGELESELIKYIYKNIKPKAINKYLTKIVSQFNSFCKFIKEYRKLDKKDINIFFDYYLPYKKLHPKVVNSIELGIVMCGGNKIEGQNFYNKVFKKRNAYTGHGPELSPWCKEFVGYKNLSEEEKKAKILEKTYNKQNPNFENFKQNSNTTLEYYLNKGYDEEIAKQMLKERQSTFSLKKCIKKYGEIEGTKRFNQRQEKWLNSLNTPENIEKLRIGRLKGICCQEGKFYSKISQDLFNKIVKKLNNKKLIIYYATNKNGEYIVKSKDLTRFPMLDFYIPELKKWIEFDGDYWHGEKRGNQQRDKQREKLIFESIPRYTIKTNKRA